MKKTAPRQAPRAALFNSDNIAGSDVLSDSPPRAQANSNSSAQLAGDGITIDKFWKNRRGEAVVVALREYEGRALVDVRTHYTDAEGKLRPNSKGIALVVARLPLRLTALRSTWA